MITAERLMLLGGVFAFLLTVHCVRTRTLREKYAVMWIVVAVLLLLAGFFPGLIMTLADAGRLSYPSAVLFLSLGAIYLFSMSVSISLSRQRRANVRLMQEVAPLRHEMNELRKSHADAAGA